MAHSNLACRRQKFTFENLRRSKSFWLKILSWVMSVKNSNRLSAYIHTKDT